MAQGESTWELPGYELCRAMGAGRHGQVWLAVEADSGALVVLRRVAGLHTDQAVALSQLGGEHLVRCRAVHQVDGEAVLVMEHVTGGSLVRRGGQLSPGQLVTALAPIALALARAHEAGLVHGRVTAAEVLLTADGKPVLDGLHLRGCGTAQDDVRALADLGLALLTDGCGGPVRDALLAAEEEGDAQDLATALLAACPAEPLRTTAISAPAAPAKRRRRWPAALAVLLLAAGLAITQVRRADRPASWASVLADLDIGRATAFARAEPSLLGRVYVPGSRVLAQDRDRLQALMALHQRAHGLRHRLSIRSATTEGNTAQLEVIASLVAYEVRGPGAERHVVRAGPPVPQHLTLARTRTGWRISGVVT